MKYLFILFTLILLSSCDCVQGAKGMVLDKATKQPLEHVAIGKYEKEDPANSYSRMEHSGTAGNYEYSSISGGLFRCPPLKLYFSKEGYKTVRVNLNKVSSDTVLLERIN